MRLGLFTPVFGHLDLPAMIETVRGRGYRAGAFG